MKPPISKFKIRGNSMLPTLKEGQEILTFNWSKPKIGDVVVIKHENKEMIKRIEKMAKDKFFVLGDNEKESTDSRHFGPIDKSQILGKVIYYLHGRNCPSRPAHSSRNY